MTNIFKKIFQKKVAFKTHLKSRCIDAVSALGVPRTVSECECKLRNYTSEVKKKVI